MHIMWMYYWQLITQALHELRARKVRSLLIMIGIVWGTLSVTLLLALGESFRQTNEAEVSSLATGAVLVWVSSTTKSYHGLAAHRPLEINTQNVEVLPQKIQHIQAVSPMQQPTQRISVHTSNRTAYTRVMGVSDAYDGMLHITTGAHQGNFFTKYQLVNHRPVAYIGYKIKEKLFGAKEALGQTIQIEGVKFLIVGYQQDDKSRKTFFKNPNAVYIPYTVYSDIWSTSLVSNFWIKTDNVVPTETVIQGVKRYYSHTMHYAPDDQGALVVFDLAKELEFFTKFFVLVEWFLAFCGIVALMVGGISVTNTLFLSVRERTREIGLRLALGARPRHILIQFMLEALVIVMVAGAVGLLLALSLIGLMQVFPLPAWLGVPKLSFKILLLTLAVLTTMGMLAGFFPARRAALMKPAQALLFS